MDIKVMYGGKFLHILFRRLSEYFASNFSAVQSLHWSCDMGNYCYLCLVHQTTVSIWKVTGATPSLHFKQVRKINASPIQQGWKNSNPITETKP